jgi:hypothetical protein
VHFASLEEREFVADGKDASARGAEIVPHAATWVSVRCLIRYCAYSMAQEDPQGLLCSGSAWLAGSAGTALHLTLSQKLSFKVFSRRLIGRRGTL